MTSSTAGAVPPRLPCSRVITIIGWVVVVASAAFLPISGCSFLMVLAGSYGTANTDLFGGLVVIAGPPATLLAGIGLVRRWRWAWAYVLMALVGFVVWSVSRIIEGPSPEITYTSASGVLNTVSARQVNTPFHSLAIAVSVGLGVFLLSRNVRSEFRIGLGQQPTTGKPEGGDGPAISAIQPQVVTAKPISSVRNDPQSSTGQGSQTDVARDWRVGHHGRDMMYYEEKHGGTWDRLEISGEMLTGAAHHVIYFASSQAWQTYPVWARQRRDEIIARVKTQFRQPDYEYGNDVLPAPQTPLGSASGVPDESDNRFSQSQRGTAIHASRQPVIHPATRKQSQALLLAIVGLMAIVVWMFWVVQSGIRTGETFLPNKTVLQRHVVSRADKPELFWVSIGLYATLGGGAFALAVWGIGAAMKDARRAALRKKADPFYGSRVRTLR